MLADFSCKHLGLQKFLASFLPKNWPNFGKHGAKNLLYDKFTPVTPKKESCKNINRSRSYKPLFERHFGKKHVSRFQYGLSCVLWRFL